MGLKGGTRGAYGPGMGTPVLRRLLLVLTVFAFVLATALPGAAQAMSMPGGATMAGSSGQPCDDCPTKAPASDSGTRMMPCGALACSGLVVALPAPAAPHLPAAGVVEYAVGVPVPPRGRALPPDPFPPRPALLV